MTIPTPGLHLDGEFAKALTDLLAEAAAIVLRAAAAAGNVTLKPDGTPVTPADLAADACLIAGLERLMPGVAVVSEERSPPSPWPRPQTFVLIDPLDGTKEFIAGRDEYAVNLAIIRDGRPVAGFMALPAFGCIYRGVVGQGADRVDMGADAAAGAFAATPVHVRTAPASGLVALASRSHPDAGTQAFLVRLGAADCRLTGSALKFCRVAEGAADVYARLAPTHEWDIAAGHAIVEAAGGRMTDRDGTNLSYGNADRDFLVSGFVAWGDPGLGVDRLLGHA